MYLTSISQLRGKAPAKVCRKDKSWTTGEAAGTMMVDGFKKCDRNTVGKTVTAACGERESNLSNSTDGKVTPWEEIQLGTYEVRTWKIAGSDERCVTGSGV